MAKKLELEQLYEVMSMFVEQCLVGEQSLLSPNYRAWTVQHLKQLKARFIDEPILGGDSSFEEKLSKQLADASPEEWLILADAMFIYYLVPRTRSISFKTKYTRVTSVLNQGGLTSPAENAEIWQCFHTGYVTTGQLYHSRYWQLWLIIIFALRLKQAEHDIDYWHNHLHVRQLVDDIIDNREDGTNYGRDMRHALLHMMFPEYYESVISTSGKEKIAKAFKNNVETSEYDDLDDVILKIRQGFSSKYDQGGEAFSFYKEPIFSMWDSGTASPPVINKDKQPTSDIIKIAAILERTNNVILYGPPGTGKTYLANEVAQYITRDQDQDLDTQGFLERVTFHQSFAYEDFIEGWRPTISDINQSGMQYEIAYGVLRRLVKRAKNNPKCLYVLLIDEINRGNIAKILGECITLLEDDKRQGKRNALSVTLPYSGDSFSIPKNIIIIGTMNTADRSVALLDVALRRRFAFIPIMPQSSLLSDLTVKIDNTEINMGTLLRSINQRIVHYLDRDYQIGHSYFLQLHGVSDDKRFDMFKYIWSYQIMPLLEEYFYSQRDTLLEILDGFELDESEELATEDVSDEDFIYALSLLINSEVQ